jgi:hypothetical protein
MEYIRGQDLRKILKRAMAKDGMPLGITLQILASVLEGLDYAHRKTDDAGRPIHIVHRDVSPQNILVSYDGDVKLVDFGIAKASTQIYQTRVGILKGKYAYMSPEQARGLPLDRRSDVFAVGILLFEVTTGRRLFRQQSEVETLKRVIECDVPPPSSVDPEYPRDLEEVLLRALQRSPADRYATARDMQLAIEDLLRRRGSILSSTRLAEFMQRLFPREIEANQEEMRVLMDARPGTAETTASTADWPTSTSTPSSPRSRPAPESQPRPPPPPPPPPDFSEEPTVLLGEQDLVRGEPEALPPTSVAANRVSRRSEPTAVLGPPAELTRVGALIHEPQRRSRTLLWVTCIAVAAAVAIAIWYATRERLSTVPPAPGTGLRPGLPAKGEGPKPAPSPAAAAVAATDAGAEEPLAAEVEDEPSGSSGRRRAPAKRVPVRALAPATGPGTLVVRTTPGTQVYVNGRLAGKTPLETTVDAGPTRVRLRNELGIDYAVPVEVRAKGRAEIQKVFGTAHLKFSVEPWAEVTLDGRTLGETPLPAQLVYEGEHVVTLRNPTLGKRESIRVHVRAGESSFIRRNWKP